MKWLKRKHYVREDIDSNEEAVFTPAPLRGRHGAGRTAPTPACCVTAEKQYGSRAVLLGQAAEK